MNIGDKVGEKTRSNGKTHLMLNQLLVPCCVRILVAKRRVDFHYRLIRVYRSRWSAGSSWSYSKGILPVDIEPTVMILSALYWALYQVVMQAVHRQLSKPVSFYANVAYSHLRTLDHHHFGLLCSSIRLLHSHYLIGYYSALSDLMSNFDHLIVVFFDMKPLRLSQ